MLIWQRVRQTAPHAATAMPSRLIDSITGSPHSAQLGGAINPSRSMRATTPLTVRVERLPHRSALEEVLYGSGGRIAVGSLNVGAAARRRAANLTRAAARCLARRAASSSSVGRGIRASIARSNRLLMSGLNAASRASAPAQNLRLADSRWMSSRRMAPRYCTRRCRGWPPPMRSDFTMRTTNHVSGSLRGF